MQYAIIKHTTHEKVTKLAVVDFHEQFLSAKVPSTVHVYNIQNYIHSPIQYVNTCTCIIMYIVYTGQYLSRGG